jgi:ABC-2 type transport system permease protein
VPTRITTHAWLSYKGLFTWFNPRGYLSSRLVLPLAMGIVFMSLGRGGLAERQQLLTAAILLTTAGSVLVGVSLAVGNERGYNTMAGILAAPHRLAMTLVVRAVPHVIDGLISAAITAAVLSGLFGVPLTTSQWLRLSAAAVAVGLSSAGMGLAASAYAVRYRDVFFMPQLAQWILIALSGVLIAPQRMPVVLRWLSSALPIHHAAGAIAPGHDLATGLGAELLTGLAWGAVGCVVISWTAHLARTRASFDLI